MKHPLTAFILTFFPGLGHIYLTRNVRGVFYMVLTIGSALLGVAAGVLTGSDVFIFGLLFALLLYGISFIDMIAMLVSGSYAGNAQRQEHVIEQVPGNEAQSERFYTILLSFIPGLGHFQIGLMQRGLNFLMMFFGMLTLIIFLTFVTGQDGFLVFLGILPVIWLYNLFDAIGMLHRKQKGEELQDKTLMEDWDHHRADGRKNTVLAAFLAFVPGAGHMYLGLQKRGLQLMAGFFFGIYVLDVLKLSLFLFVIPLLWFFSFFDAMQLITKYREGSEELKDVPVVDWLLHRQKWVGVALIVLGGYFLASQILLPVLSTWVPQLTVWFDRYFQTVMVSVLLIGGGIRLLWGSSGKRGRSV